MPEVKKLETLFYKFLWNKKPDKIKREIIVQKLEDGGLNKPDVNQFIKSLKISWIRRFHQSNATWRFILIQDLPLFDRTLQWGPEFLLKLRSNTRNKFQQDVLTPTHTFARKTKGDTYEQFPEHKLSVQRRCQKLIKRLILIQDLPLFDRTLQWGPEFLLKLRSNTRNKFQQDVLTPTHTFARKTKGDTYEQFPEHKLSVQRRCKKLIEKP